MASKSQKGSGGKRGHSGQDNYMTHREEKALGRSLRRREGRKAEQDAKRDLSDEGDG